MKISVLELFAGIGGIGLGLENTGFFNVIGQVEIDDYCRKVLEKHWPDVPRWADIHDFNEALRNGEIEIKPDLVCGGFPCQPVSCAGKRKGDSDERWLWPQFIETVRLVKPRWVMVENVPGLLSIDSGRLFSGILRDLAEAGYDAEWGMLRASDAGAPHRRERVFIIGHPNSEHGRRNERAEKTGRKARPLALGHISGGPSGRTDKMAHTSGSGLEGRDSEVMCKRRGKESFGGGCAPIPDANNAKTTRQREHGGQIYEGPETERPDGGSSAEWWAVESGVGRVVDGISNRVDRLKCLGNAVVPQVAQLIGERIALLNYIYPCCHTHLQERPVTASTHRT